MPPATDTDPMGTTNSDLSLGAEPAFNTISPNGCDDGDASCAPLNDRIRQYDNFLAREVHLIEASPAGADNGVIVLTYDEDQRMGGLPQHNALGHGDHTVCAVSSPMVGPGNSAARRTPTACCGHRRTGSAWRRICGHAADVSELPVTWK